MTSASITDAAHAMKFMHAGRARVTLKSRKTDVRYTYRIGNKSDVPHLYFVSLLSGPDNESDYVYLGTVFPEGFRLTKKSALKDTSAPVAAFKYAHQHLMRGEIPAQLEIWHEGKCGRCGRPLTDPTSIARGFGPECVQHV